MTLSIKQLSSRLNYQNIETEATFSHFNLRFLEITNGKITFSSKNTNFHGLHGLKIFLLIFSDNN